MTPLFTVKTVYIRKKSPKQQLQQQLFQLCSVWPSFISLLLQFQNVFLQMFSISSEMVSEHILFVAVPTLYV